MTWLDIANWCVLHGTAAGIVLPLAWIGARMLIR